ncbi:MAG: YesL family protein [Candidatus Faecivicinus sp.]
MWKKKLREQDAAPSVEPDTPFNGPLWRFFGRLADLFLLMVYWVATSWPIVTIGASTTALFYVCFRLRQKNEGKLWQMYIKSFKENLKQATFIWLLYLFAALDVFLVGFSLCRQGLFQPADFSIDGGKYYPALLTVCLVYGSIMLYTAALLAMFRQTTGQCIGAAIMMAFGRLPSTLLFLIIIWALSMATLYLFPPLILIDVPLAVWLISKRMYTLFQKQIRQAEKGNAGDSEENKTKAG